MHSEYMYYGKSLLRVPNDDNFVCVGCVWEGKLPCPFTDRKKFKDIPVCLSDNEINDFIYVHGTKENHEKYEDVLEY
jgi:hypothetical protein